MDYDVDLFVIPSIPSKQLGSLKVAVGVRGSGETEHCRGGDALGVNKFYKVYIILYNIMRR